MGTTNRSRAISFMTVAAMFGALLSRGSKRKTDKIAKYNGTNYLQGKPQYHGNPIFFPKRTKFKGYMREGGRA